MAGGILLDRLVDMSLGYAVAILVVGGAMLAVLRRYWLARGVALALAAVALGAVLHDNAFRRIPHNHIVRYAADEPVLVKLTGTLLTDPFVYERPGGHFARWVRGRARTRMLVQVEQIEGQNGLIDVTGRIRVYVKEPLLHLRAGERARLVGRLYRLPGPDNPGELDWSLLARRQGILAGMSCKYANAITRLDSDDRPTPVGIRHSLRTTLRRLLYQEVTVPDESASLLDAIVLGQREGVARHVNDAFIRTGTAHFLAVSGMHVGMLAVFIWWMARAVGFERRLGAAIVFGVVAGYVLVAEPRVPILRAGILCALGCAAVGMRRRTSPLNWLAAGAIILLAWRPCDLFSPGFQLSFGVVLSILLLGPVVYATFEWVRQRVRRIPPELDDPRPLWSPWRRWREGTVTRLTWLGAIAIAAWLVGSALTAYHFGRFSPWGWINSILVWPFVMAIVIGGFVKVLLAAAWPQTAAITGPMLGWASQVLVACVDGLNRLPWVSIECRQPSWWSAAAYLCGLTTIAICWRLGVRRRWLAVLGLLPCAAIAVGAVRLSDPPGGLRMWVLSVGPGQVALLDTPDAGHWVCDAGTSLGFDVGEVTAVPAFRHLGVQRIDRAVVSHANFDHYNGLLAIDDHFPVEGVVISPHFAGHVRPGGAARFLLDELERRDIPMRIVRAGDQITGNGQTAAEVLWPPGDLPAKWSPNNCALVIRIQYAGRSILLCGDIEDEAQRRLVDRGDLRSDVLVLPHHGAVTRSTSDFIAAVDPEIVIRSGGRRTDPAVIERIVDGRRYFDTARDGAVEVTIRQDGLSARAPFKQEDTR